VPPLPGQLRAPRPVAVAASWALHDQAMSELHADGERNANVKLKILSWRFRQKSNAKERMHFTGNAETSMVQVVFSARDETQCTAQPRHINVQARCRQRLHQRILWRPQFFTCTACWWVDPQRKHVGQFE
jgi:hypothetical protein